MSYLSGIYILSGALLAYAVTVFYLTRSSKPVRESKADEAVFWTGKDWIALPELSPTPLEIEEVLYHMEIMSK